jgi:hypothetical protein
MRRSHRPGPVPANTNPHCRFAPTAADRDCSASAVSGRFDSAWSLQQLEAALQGGSGILDLESVLKRMAVLTTEHPMQVAKLLELIVLDERACDAGHKLTGIS